MLQKLDTEHLNRLALAEALASMKELDFDMRDPRRCICGHALRMLRERWSYVGAGRARSVPVQACWAFDRASAGVIRSGQTCEAIDPYTHPQDAARVVRYLAATDTVDWGVAGKL